MGLSGKDPDLQGALVHSCVLHTKATVSLDFCELEGLAVQLDQLKSLLNGYLSHKTL